jgi:hypothetical protein
MHSKSPCFILCSQILKIYYYGDKINEDEMGGTRSTHGRYKKCIYMEDGGTDGRIILEWILGKQGGEGADWIHLALDRDQWQTLVTTVINLQDS